MLVPLVMTTVCNLVWGIYEIAKAGIVAVVILLHPSNAEEPMLVTLSGIVMLVSSVQPENAEEPIILVLAWIVAEVMEVRAASTKSK